METTSPYLLTFLLNALWQIPVAATVAALISHLMRNGPAVYRHSVWVAALAAAVLLPIASTRREAPVTTPQFDITLLTRDASPAPPQTHIQLPAPLTMPPVNAPRTIWFAGTTAAILTGAYLLFVFAGLVRLVLASIRTVAMRRSAFASKIPERFADVWNRCHRVFGVANVELLFSKRISGPITAGRAIILPERFCSEASDEVLTTAIGHEMAHIARRDFPRNICFEIFSLPVSFHPALWLIRRGIERAREMACDELVSGRLIDPTAYARSILSIAEGMTMAPQPGHTLSVLDGNNLEERIRRLIERPAASLQRPRLLLATGLAALALCVVIASSLSLTARAQDAAGDLLKAAAAAYDRGDYQEAVNQFENAVRLEPANLKARLLLANALLRQYVPGTDPSNPLVSLAQQQYREVLALDPANKPALEGMMLLYTNTKQFAEAHEWALKAIQADSSNKTAYYTAGFVDWAMTYPDYAAARRTAGMKNTDNGNIPDPALRQSIREKHLAQVEDGFRMLQIALQLDPGDSSAMAYMNLLDRIQAGLADTPEQAAEYIAKADSWVGQAVAAKRKAAQSSGPAKPLDTNGPIPAPFPSAPPPPPPPPPPSGWQGAPRADGTVTVPERVQGAKLISAPLPIYPPEARNAGVSGNVLLNITVARDGSVASADAVKGDPILATAAIQAVKQWKYEPTLLNGEPVQVTTEVSVNFTLGNE